MALPENKLSTLPVPAPFLSPRDKVVGFLESWHIGGVGLSDPTQGLRFQDWHAVSDGSSVFVSAPNWPLMQLFFTAGAGISFVDLAFDQNMHPAVAYVEGGQAKLWWFDPLPNEITVLDLDPLDKNPRIALDDSRALSVNGGISDMILAYTRGGSLYYRQQRDRFTVERLLVANTGLVRLLTVGMTEANRFQFFFGGDIPPFIAPTPVPGGGTGPFQPAPPPPPIPPSPPGGPVVPTVIPNLDFSSGLTGWKLNGDGVLSISDGAARYVGTPGSFANTMILTEGVLVSTDHPVNVTGRVRIVSTSLGITSVGIRVGISSTGPDGIFFDALSIIGPFSLSSPVDGTLAWTDLAPVGAPSATSSASPAWIRIGVVIQNPVGAVDVMIDDFTVTASTPA